MYSAHGRSFVVIALLGLPTVAWTAGCGDSGTDPPEVALTITLSAAVDTFRSVGQRVQLEVVVTDPLGDPQSTALLSWVTSDAGVLGVSGPGLVTSVGNGTATITASSGASSGTIMLTVSQRVATLLVRAPADTAFSLGIRSRFVADARDSLNAPVPGAFAPANWESSDVTVATIDEAGRALPLGGGGTEITATVQGLSASAPFAVNPIVPVEIDLGTAEAFQWLVEDSLSATGLFGLSGAVILPGRGVWVGTAGMSETAEQLRPSMATSVGSITKTTTGALITQLADQGLLDLDDPIGDWLPPFPGIPASHIPASVTIRQLLLHTSGIFSFTRAANFSDSIVADLQRAWEPTEIIQTFVGPPDFAPGSGWSASQTGYYLLGMIAEAVTGSTVHDELRTRFWEPLGLTNIYMGGRETPPGLVAGSRNGSPGGPLEDFAMYAGPAFSSIGWTASGINATAGDVARWAAALFGNQFHSTGMMAEIRTTVQDTQNIPGQIGAGLGVRRYDYLGRDVWGHSGVTSNGSALVLYDDATGITVVAAINQNPGSHGSQHFPIAIALLSMALGN